MWPTAVRQAKLKQLWKKGLKNAMPLFHFYLKNWLHSLKLQSN
jgi:hypothetical protein